MLWHRSFHALWMQRFYNSKQQFSRFPLPGILGDALGDAAASEIDKHTFMRAKGLMDKAPQMTAWYLVLGFDSLLQESLHVFQ